MPAVSASRHRCRQPIGEFCWLDLAATDASRAKNFYHAMFGWNAVDCAANGGYFTRLSLSEIRGSTATLWRSSPTRYGTIVTKPARGQVTW